jgi:hypothetical protein
MVMDTVASSGTDLIELPFQVIRRPSNRVPVAVKECSPKTL